MVLLWGPVDTMNMRITDRPENNAICSGCEHKFGDHYKTMDGRVGCEYTRPGNSRCACRKFTTVVIHLQ